MHVLMFKLLINLFSISYTLRLCLYKMTHTPLQQKLHIMEGQDKQTKEQGPPQIYLSLSKSCTLKD